MKTTIDKPTIITVTSAPISKEGEDTMNDKRRGSPVLGRCNMAQDNTPFESLPPKWQKRFRELEKTIERLVLKLQKKGRTEKKLRVERQRPTAQ